MKNLIFCIVPVAFTVYVTFVVSFYVSLLGIPHTLMEIRGMGMAVEGMIAITIDFLLLFAALWSYCKWGYLFFHKYR